MRVRAALAGALLVVLLTGCSEETPPAVDVPALSEDLAAVEAAVGAGDFDKVRSALERLVARASRAELAGDISAEEADRIREAARAVLAQLPAAGD